MITSGNKTWRNLQEQVAYLTAMIGQATDVVKNVQGIVATTGDLPAASSFTSGTTYAVGASAPYEYYVAIAGNWVDIGEFPLAGPAGADGENGKAIFLTSAATTSGTIAITAASIYNPDGLSIGKGDLILSDEGNVFAITRPNSIPGYNVVYRFNIMGPTGATGAPGAPGSIICYTAQTPASTATTIPAGYVTSDIRTPAAGDMLIASNCNVFEITGLSGSDYTIDYILNIKGATGSRGAQIGYTTETLSQVSASVPISTVTAAQTVAPGDILVSVNGWIFIVSGVSGSNLIGSCPTGANLTGPTGADGADGAPGADGADGSIICYTAQTTASTDTTIPAADVTSDIRTPVAGDMLIASNCNVFEITGLSGSDYTIDYILNIKGAAGPSGSHWFSGTDMIYSEGSGISYLYNDSSTYRAGDYYIIASDYTSNGHDFHAGEVFRVTSGTVVATCSFVLSILGPQGSPGAAGQNGSDGATWYSGTDILYDGQDDYLYLDDEVFTTAKVGDLYLCTSTLILGSGQDTVTVRAGDIYKITELEQMGWKLTYQMNNTALDLNIIAIKVPIIELDGDVDVDIQQVI